MRACMEKDWNMMEKRLVMGICFLAGMVLGFMLSPVKKEVYCGNHNVSSQVANDKKES